MELTRGLWLGDLTVSYADLKSPELHAALAEMQELIREIGQNPDDKERFGEWRGRITELKATIRGALGLEIEGQS